LGEAEKELMVSRFSTSTVVEAVLVLLAVSLLRAQSVLEPFWNAVVSQLKEYTIVPLAVEVEVPRKVLEAKGLPNRPSENVILETFPSSVEEAMRVTVEDTVAFGEGASQERVGGVTSPINVAMAGYWLAGPPVPVLEALTWIDETIWPEYIMNSA
jgi:hypothetical protein